MRRLLSTLAAAVLFAIPSQVQAQWIVGPGLGWHDDFDLGIGVFAVTPLPSLHENVSIGGDLGYFFPDCGGSSESGSIDCSYFEINANLFYTFQSETEMPVTPFVLGGLAIQRFSVDSDVDINVPGFEFDYGASSTDIALNVGGGIKFNASDTGIQPIVGAKIEIGDGSGFVIFGGLGFPVGG